MRGDCSARSTVDASALAPCQKEVEGGGGIFVPLSAVNGWEGGETKKTFYGCRIRLLSAGRGQGLKGLAESLLMPTKKKRVPRSLYPSLAVNRKGERGEEDC